MPEKGVAEKAETAPVVSELSIDFEGISCAVETC